MSDEQQILEEAMWCAENGGANHWPTVANILAHEITRLRAEVLAGQQYSLSQIRAVTEAKEVIERLRAQLAQREEVEPVKFEDHDCGIINDWGGGNVGWWQDYIRSEINRANEFWREQVESEPLYTHSASNGEPKDCVRVPDDSIKRIATTFFRDWYNSPGSNTDQGFDDWWKENREAMLKAAQQEGENHGE